MGWSLPFTAVISARRTDAKLPRPRRRCHLRESGNVFMMLFGAVAMVGVIGAATMTVMKGPVKTMSMVTKRTVAENNMIAAGKLALIAAASQTNNDCDGDLYVEPLPFGATVTGFTGGGELPTQIGVAKQDPWGRLYVYCAWDHGPTIDDAACGGATQNRLQGTNAETEYTLAIISAGPNGVYSTTCNDFVDANSDNIPDTPLVNKTAGSDDIVLGYTYAEAGSLSGGLWGLQDPNTAEITKNLSVKDTGGTEQFAFDAGTKTLTIGGTGEFPSIKTDFLSALTGGGDISVLSPIASSADITTTGKVGIGTTTPLSGLHINGNETVAGQGRSSVTLTDSSVPEIWHINNFGSGSLEGGGKFGINLGGVGNYFAITPTGNVGIGTSAPFTKLQVNAGTDKDLYFTGGIASYGSVTGSAIFSANDANSAFTDLSIAAANLVLQAGPGTGNVGIGTSTPSAKLDVAGNIKTSGVAPIIYFDETDQTDPLGQFRVVGDGGSFSIRRKISAGTWVGETYPFKINSSGNVSIGTSTPSAKLHILGNAQVLALEGTDHSYIGYYPDGVGAGRKAYVGFPGPAINDFAIDNEFSTGVDLTIANTGNVGIGTTAPGAKLDVAGGVKHGNDAGTCNAGKAGTIRWNGTAFEGCDGTSWAAIGSGGGISGYEIVSNTIAGSGHFNVGVSCPVGKTVLGGGCYQTPTTYRALVQNNPNGTTGWNCRSRDITVAQATTLTAYAICGNATAGGGGGGGADNLGNHTATQDLDLATNNITNAGNVTATAYFHSSDARLKMDIEPISGMDILDQLQGVRYKWKKDGQTAAGILAQDVEKVMPYAVTEDKNGIKAVEYDQLVAPLIEAVKAQQDQINTMRRELDALKAE